MTEYELTRSARARRVSLTVRGSQVRVSAPESVPLREINRFVDDHEQWIARRQRDYQRRLLDLELQPNQLLLNGEPLTVRHVPTTSSRSRAALEGDLVVTEPLRSENPQVVVQNAIVAWYRDVARQASAAWIDKHADDFSRLPESVFIKDTKSRWGSCSARNVNLSWRLAMAPEQVFEYVVVHELCHLDHPNHSPAFWAAVEQRLPNFQQAEKWLKRYGSVLHALI